MFHLLTAYNLKIQYNRHRHYNYRQGRWYTHDPLKYADGMNLYEYVSSNPMIGKDPKGLVKCGGGKWWFAGRMINSNWFAVSYTSIRARWTCQKRRLRGWYEYECCGVTFKRKIYEQPYALGMIRALDIGPALGGSLSWITGEQSGASTSAELSGHGLRGPSASISIVLGGASISGGRDNSSSSIGLSPGFGVTASLVGGSDTTIYASGMERVEESLPRAMRQMIQQVRCSVKYVPATGEVWESTPISERPIGSY